MNLIKRITTSVTATLDNAVCQLENHEAIINATIKETRQSVAKTKARINTLRQQATEIESKINEAMAQSKLWEDRARNLADSDQDKALQCLARHNRHQQDHQRWNESAAQQQQLITDVEASLLKLETKLEDMQRKHTALRSRQSVADVNAVVVTNCNEHDLSDTFERWESSVLERELSAQEGSYVDGFKQDQFEQEFEQQESQSALLQQLANLSSTDKGDRHE